MAKKRYFNPNSYDGMIGVSGAVGDTLPGYNRLAGVSVKQEDGDGDMMPLRSMDPYNMPKEVKMQNYPMMDYLQYPNYADSYKEKDRQTNRMVRKTSANSGEKY